MTYGLKSIRLFLPATGVPRSHIADALSRPGASKAAGERRIANFDEDHVTFAWEALNNVAVDDQLPVIWGSLGQVDGLSRDSSIVATTLGWPCGISKVIGGPRSGWDLVANTVAAESPLSCALAATSITKSQESLDVASSWSDAAAGVVWGDDAPLKVAGVFSHDELLNECRENTNGSVEIELSAMASKRYLELVKLAATDLGLDLEKTVLVVSTGLAGVAKKCTRLGAKRVFTTDFKSRGYCGVADGAFVLADALQAIDTDEDILFCIQGEGMTAFHFKASKSALPEICLPQWQEAQNTAGMARWLRFRESVRDGIPGPAGSQVLSSKDSEWALTLNGVRCGDCDAVSFPPQEGCHVCGSQNIESQKLARTGEVFTLTVDHLHPSYSTPTTMIVADMDGGGRVYLQGCDDLAHDVKIGMPVELAFRRIHDGDDGRTAHYFWKLRTPG